MGVETEVHQPPAGCAFRIEHIELFLEQIESFVRGVAATHENHEVVDFIRVGDRDDRAVVGMDQIGLIVVEIIGRIEQALFGKNIYRRRVPAER